MKNMFFGRKIRTILHEFGEKGALVLVMTAITRVAPDQLSFFFSSPEVFFRVEYRASVFIVLRIILLRLSTFFPLRSSLALGTKKTKYAPMQQL